MIYTTENNWYQYGYNGIKFARREYPNDTYQTFYDQQKNIQFGSLKEELLKAARSSLDTYPGLRPSIMFSGGVDSETVLRSFIEIGSKPIAYIFRYENDYNIYDVSYAIAICSSLNVEHKLIDFNLKNFYETDAEKIAELSQQDRPRALPQIKFMDYVDGLPIYGFSDINWYRTDDDYAKKGTWLARCWEFETNWSKYIKEINRPAIGEWFKWSPGLVLASLKSTWLNNLILDQYYGKLGIHSTKIIGYREAYPNLIERRKQTGFEKTDHIMFEFEKFLEKKFNGLHQRSYYDRTYKELVRDITGQEEF